MEPLRGETRGAPPGLRARHPWQVWVDLSLRTKLLLFGLVLVTLPGGLFALVAFSGARAALEREVEIQLQQTAERGADALSTALERAESDARSWASQDVMRDLLVGDLDKRVSRFLRTARESKAAYLEVLCADRRDAIVAASNGKWLGRTLPAAPEAGPDGAALLGPRELPDFAHQVLEISVPIENPDAPAGRIGRLILLYDWSGVSEILEGMRVKLAKLGKHVGAIVIDRGGKVIGGVAIDGQPAERSALVSEAWRALPAGGDGEHAASGSRDDAVELLFGAAEVSHPRVAWSVVLLEPAREALAPVRRMRDRWIAVTAGLLLAGLALATLLARQVMRPLDEVTRATSRVASHPDLDLPLLPVRSRNEVGELAESFNKMAVELKRSHTEALSAAKFAFAGELAAMVAHEIRTPLSVMRSSAQMLTGDTGAGAARNAELVDSIVAEVDRIERVVTGLIQLASPLEQRPEPTPLADVLSRAAAFARAQAKRLQIEITCDVAGGAPPALCDREQIYQVVLNLLVNALQALPPGGHVELRTLAEDSGTVGFAVGDDGPGLPAAIRDRVFLPFVTGRAEGTGLGLAFVDRIVKAHHGSVSVHSECGQGTVFEVRLPAAVAPR